MSGIIEKPERRTLETATRKAAAGLGSHVGVLKEGIVHSNNAAARVFAAQTNVLRATLDVQHVRKASEGKEEFMDRNAEMLERMIERLHSSSENIAAVLEAIDKCEGSAQEILSMTRSFPLAAVDSMINDQLGRFGSAPLEPSNLKEVERKAVQRTMGLPDIDHIVTVEEGSMPLETIVSSTLENYRRSGDLFATAVGHLESAQKDMHEASELLLDCNSKYRHAHDAMEGGRLSGDTKSHLRELIDDVGYQAGKAEELAGNLKQATENTNKDMVAVLQNMGRYIRSAFASAMYSEDELVKPVTQEQAVQDALAGNRETLKTYLGQQGVDIEALVDALGAGSTENGENAVEALKVVALSSNEMTKAADMLHALSLDESNKDTMSAALAAMAELSQGAAE